MKKSHPLSRRSFLGQANCAAIGALPVLNTLLNLKLAGSVAAAAPGANDYRALVCLFFSGGRDSFNVLVPLIESVWLRFGPFMRLVYGRFGTAILIDQHERAIEAIAARDEAGLRAAIRADILDGMNEIGAASLVD